MDQTCMTGRREYRQPYPNYTRDRVSQTRDYMNARNCRGTNICMEVREQAESCENKKCTRDGEFWKNMPVGMTYVPWQEFGTPMEIGKGFCKGTIFPCLDYPFFMGGCCK